MVGCGYWREMGAVGGLWFVCPGWWQMSLHLSLKQKKGLLSAEGALRQEGARRQLLLTHLRRGTGQVSICSSLLVLLWTESHVLLTRRDNSDCVCIPPPPTAVNLYLGCNQATFNRVYFSNPDTLFRSGHAQPACTAAVLATWVFTHPVVSVLCMHACVCLVSACGDVLSSWEACCQSMRLINPEPLPCTHPHPSD